MIITLKEGRWVDKEGVPFNKILETHGVDARKVEEFLNGGEFVVRTKFNSVIKIEKRGNSELKLTPYYSDKDNSLKYVFMEGKLQALTDRAEKFIDNKTGFLDLKLLKENNLDYYIETRENGLSVVGLINKIDSSEFDNIDGFHRDVKLISFNSDDILSRPNYLSVIRCYDDITMSQLKNQLSNAKRFMKDLRVYHTGLQEFTLLSKFSVNHLIVGDLIATFKTTSLLNFEEEHLILTRKRLFQEIGNNRIEEEENILKGYFRALYNKTDETVEHSERMRMIVTLIGQELLLSDEEFDTLLKMSTIHDIGKLAIEGKIINKPGKLTDDEYNIIKKHTVLGYEMMEGLSSYLSAREAPLLHHERWDGKGYPTGISGEEIPLLVRILSIADAIDTMASKRVYKESFSFEYIKDELEDKQGNQFCPQVTRVALNIFDKIKELY